MPELTQNHYVEVNGHQIRYIEQGSGKPIIFQSGLGFDDLVVKILKSAHLDYEG